jgi:hypothetical protein
MTKENEMAPDPNDVITGEGDDHPVGDPPDGSESGDLNVGNIADEGDLAKQLQRERSSRGREVSSLKTELARMKENIDMLTSQLSRPVPSTDGDESPVKYITTPQELEQHLAWKATQTEKKRREYAVQYVHSAKGLRYLNPELHDEIEKELLYSDTKYNSVTGFADPAKDSEYNYRIAESNILKKKLAEVSTGKPIVRGTGNNPPTGITATSTNVASSGKKKVELDGYAKKFIDSIGEKGDSDWVQTSVQRDDLQ